MNFKFEIQFEISCIYHTRLVATGRGTKVKKHHIYFFRMLLLVCDANGMNVTLESLKGLTSSEVNDVCSSVNDVWSTDAEKLKKMRTSIGMLHPKIYFDCSLILCLVYLQEHCFATRTSMASLINFFLRWQCRVN